MLPEHPRGSKRHSRRAPRGRAGDCRGFLVGSRSLDAAHVWRYIYVHQFVREKNFMKKPTMGADKTLIAAAQDSTAIEGTTSNAQFRQRQEDCAQRKRRAEEALKFVSEL